MDLVCRSWSASARVKGISPRPCFVWMVTKASRFASRRADAERHQGDGRGCIDPMANQLPAGEGEILGKGQGKPLYTRILPSPSNPSSDPNRPNCNIISKVPWGTPQGVCGCAWVRSNADSGWGGVLHSLLRISRLRICRLLYSRFRKIVVATNIIRAASKTMKRS